MRPVTFTPIGVVRSPFTALQNMPLQTVAARGVAGSIELYPAYREGLKDLDGFSHLLLVTHLHLMTSSSLTVTPFLDDQPRGVFATRSPKRPNPIGLSLVRLRGILGDILSIEDVDLVDGTPLLDIKPFVPALDRRPPPYYCSGAFLVCLSLWEDSCCAVDLGPSPPSPCCSSRYWLWPPAPPPRG